MRSRLFRDATKTQLAHSGLNSLVGPQGTTARFSDRIGRCRRTRYNPVQDPLGPISKLSCLAAREDAVGPRSYDMDVLLTLAFDAIPNKHASGFAYRASCNTYYAVSWV